MVVVVLAQLLCTNLQFMSTRINLLPKSYLVDVLKVVLNVVQKTRQKKKKKKKNVVQKRLYVKNSIDSCQNSV